MTHDRRPTPVLRIFGWAVSGLVSLASLGDRSSAQAQTQAQDPPPPAAVDAQVGGELTLEIERFGVGGICRPGDWIGIRAVVNDAAGVSKTLTLDRDEFASSTIAALKALSEEGKVPVAQVAEAIKKYGIKVDKINPLYA